jgi:hypothetical protein
LFGSELLLDLAEVATRLTVVETRTHGACVCVCVKSVLFVRKRGGGYTQVAKNLLQFFENTTKKPLYI